jgi:hypothetical protein
MKTLVPGSRSIQNHFAASISYLFSHIYHLINDHLYGTLESLCLKIGKCFKWQSKQARPVIGAGIKNEGSEKNSEPIQIQMKKLTAWP